MRRCTEPARGQPCRIVQAESEPVLCGFPCTVMIFCISDTLELGCLFITFDMIGPALKIQCQWAYRLNGQGAEDARDTDMYSSKNMLTLRVPCRSG